MNDAILIQQVYPGLDYEPMLELTRQWNTAYCEKHAFDYWCLIDEVVPEWNPWQTGGWAKIELIRRAALEGYKSIVWLDADAFIKDIDRDLRDAIETNRIGVCWHRIPQLHHWNVGVMYIDNTPGTREFIEQWIAGYPPKDGWFEQGVFNAMGRKSDIVSTLSDKWNSTLDVNLVPDAVVLGFHGQGDPKKRYEIMKDTFYRLFPAQKALATQGMSEVTNG
jgi:hypothetical protein